VYTLDAFGHTYRRTADEYGEVHISFQVPSGISWGPHADESIVLRGHHPSAVGAVLYLNCVG
jgi:hypothetical protein